MPIRIGIVGAGKDARTFVDVLQTLDDARVVAVCDKNIALAESLARRCKARAFRDARAMLKPPTKREIARELARRKSEVAENAAPAKIAVPVETEKMRTLDAVCILSSERTRNESMILALQNGCEVFVAQPLALSLDGAKRILQFAQDNRARIWASHDARFSPSCEHARKLLQARGAKVLCLNGSWKTGESEGNNKAARDAQLLASSTRLVDTLRFINGEIKSVFARSVNSNITLSIEFQNGVVGAIVLGEQCETALLWTTQNSLLMWNEDEIILRQSNTKQQIEYSNGLQTAQKNELRAWLQSVESGRRTLAKSKNEDAIINLRVALAIAQSIKTNKPVRLVV